LEVIIILVNLFSITISSYLALVSDAVLHIIPELFEMSHDEEIVDTSKIVIKGSVPFSCVILFSMKKFFSLTIIITKVFV
jgi:hypothetical protein